MKNYNNEILADCAWFADKHRGENKQSGPYWSTIIRFPKLYDEAIRLQKRVDTLEAYIDEFTPDSMQIAQLKSENERLREALVKISLADTDAYRENHYHELKRVVDIAEQTLKEE